MKTKKAYSRIGLDIGNFTLKSVELTFLKDSVELSGFSLEPLGAGLAGQLKSVFPSPRGVNISVSGASTVVRYIYFPRMNRDELTQSLKFEVQKYIPFPIGEVNLDCHILKEDAADNKMLVLVAAAKKELIERRLKSLREAGLKADIIDLDSLALINAFKFNYSQDEAADIKNKTVALLNIGASTSNINILEGGIPVLSRDIYIGGNTLADKIKEATGTDFDPEASLNPGGDKEASGRAAAVAEQVVSGLSKEIRVSFDFYESQSSSSVTKIFLSGGGSRLSGLQDMMSVLLGIEVECWDPFKRINIAGAIDAQRARALSGQLAIAVGLALRK